MMNELNARLAILWYVSNPTNKRDRNSIYQEVARTVMGMKESDFERVFQHLQKDYFNFRQVGDTIYYDLNRIGRYVMKALEQVMA